MKRFIAILNDSSYVNVPADRMTISDDGIIAWDGENPVAYVDIGFALTAHISDRKDDLSGTSKAGQRL